MGKSDEGFAKGYKSVWQIVKINELTLMDEFPVGADRDGHGCIGSAGYVWSEAVQDCIRLFESGIRTEAVDGSGRSVSVGRLKTECRGTGILRDAKGVEVTTL